MFGGSLKKNFNGKELEYILNGELPVNFDMSKVNEITKEFLDKGKATQESRRIHCVLFFLPQAVLSNPNQGNFRRLLTLNYEFIAKHAKLNPLLVVTKVDEISDIRKNSSGPWPDLDKRKAEAARLLNIPPARVLYNINYLDEKRKNFHIDKMTYTIMREAIISAQTYAKSLAIEEEVW